MAPAASVDRFSEAPPVEGGAVPKPSRADLCALLGVPDLDTDLLDRALTHRSYAYENGGLPTNERLEFLGDSVLGVVITESLYLAHPDLSEGRLAKLRAAVVNARALADVARTLGLGEHILLGRGEESTGGRDKSSILSDTVEALIGAVYLDKGFAVATDVVHRLFDPMMDAAADLGAGLDWKTSLQELAADYALGVPEYLIRDSGPDHAKTFVARVRVGDGVYGHGTGKSKKEAEQQAAETAWHAVRAEHTAQVSAQTPDIDPHEDARARRGIATHADPRLDRDIEPDASAADPAGRSGSPGS
jgi:ribonuclease III